MSRKKNYSKKKILEAIKGSGGIMSNVARALGCTWHTAALYLKQYPECVKALEEEEETMLDAVEQTGYDLAKQGDGAMIRFYLSTKGRKRGYVTDDKLLPSASVAAGDNTVRLVIDIPEKKE